MSFRWIVILGALLAAGCIPASPPPAPTEAPAALTATAAEAALRATASALGTALAETARAPSPTTETAAPAATETPTPTSVPLTRPPLETLTPTHTGEPPARPNTPPPTPTSEPPARPSPELPVIVSFTALPAEIDPGGAVTLTWEARADEVTVWRIAADGRLAEFFTVGPAGSLTVNAPDGQRTPVQFMLFAARGGVTVEAGASVSVRCPDAWFFANPPPGCPQSAAHTTALQAQYFERGLMLWTQWNDRIYILYGPQHGASYQVRANQWFAGMPESDPALVPPAGLYQPVRGFGAAWRDEQALEGTRVRDRLGWALAEEFSVPDAAFQCDSAPKYVTCFITGPGGVVLELRPEGSGWRPWSQ